jgi:hypothetical protein
MQRSPAFLPLGMPGIAEEMDGAMQHAPQANLHSMLRFEFRPRKVERGDRLLHFRDGCVS